MNTNRTRIPDIRLRAYRLLFSFLLILACLLVLGVISSRSAAVEIAWFEVHSGSRIKLEWKTGSEMHLAGFFLRRSEKGGDSPEDYTRIEVEDKTRKRTVYISPGTDSVAGSLYEYWDPGAREGKTHYYLLEVIDSDNGSQFHGPVKAFCCKKGMKEDAR